MLRRDNGIVHLPSLIINEIADFLVVEKKKKGKEKEKRKWKEM